MSFSDAQARPCVDGARIREELIAAGLLVPQAEAAMRPVTLPHDYVVFRLDDAGRAAAKRHIAAAHGNWTPHAGERDLRPPTIAERERIAYG